MALTGSTWNGMLEPTDDVQGFHYVPRFRVFDADGQFQWEETLDVQIHVPPGGGDLGAFPGVEFGPSSVRVQLEHPRISDPSFTGWWLEAAPGDPDPGTATGSGRFVLII